MDDESDFEEITGIFDRKYMGILNDPRCQTRTTTSLDTYVCKPKKIITLDHLNKSISTLNNGLGWDNIHALHFKYSGPVFRNLFAKFLDSLVIHAFVPEIMVRGRIKPIIKNNALSKTDSNNYRPVMN